eukprot:SAG25_NODE_2426_length_1619_cov_1.320395_2_plen_184_part_00
MVSSAPRSMIPTATLVEPASKAPSHTPLQTSPPARPGSAAHPLRGLPGPRGRKGWQSNNRGGAGVSVSRREFNDRQLNDRPVTWRSKRSKRRPSRLAAKPTSRRPSFFRGTCTHGTEAETGSSTSGSFSTHSSPPGPWPMAPHCLLGRQVNAMPRQLGCARRVPLASARSNRPASVHPVHAFL